MQQHFLRAVLVGAALAPLSSAQAQFEVLPFPLSPTGATGAMGAMATLPQSDVVSALTGLDTVVLTGVALPDGQLLDLQLEQLNLERHRFGFHVDGRPAPDLLAGTNLSVWKGQVVGQADSIVMLAFSDYGSRGWIEMSDQLVHFMPQPDGDGDWRGGEVLVITEKALNERGFELDPHCEALAPEREILPPVQPAQPSQPGGAPDTYGPTGCGLRNCPIAFETDYQLFQVFNDLNAMTTYVTTLLSFVSDRYETQVNTVLTFPYMQFYTNSNDPWSAQDNGGNCQDVLFEFRDTWVGNVPAGANLGHLMSGANLGCGVAWLDVLCSNSNNFSVSGNIDGNVNFPVVQQPNNWDFIVVAHELGHNFASPHTHDYCPPLDECPAQQYWGQCQDEQICLTNGTIMSYCHLCPGGTGNITTFFHPTAAGVMTNAAAACLDFYSGLSGDSPDLLDPQNATPVTAQLTGTAVGSVTLWYRYDGGSFQSIAMTDMGGGDWAAMLPAPDCGDSPEYYYEVNEATCGLITAPDGAPGNVFTANVGTAVVSFGDDFESDTGWAATNLGASTGDWQRGVPVNDPNWDYDPTSDSDGSGSAYLTENQLGNTDVDGGSVQLMSPSLDLTAAGVEIRYDYFLRLTNENGDDRILVEISENGAAGPWTEIARHDTNGGLDWRSHLITATDLASAGVTPTADMRLRFTANDDGTQSIVEAGLDAFSISSVDCGGGAIGTNYCTSSANSTGSPAIISATGSNSVGANDLGLEAAPVPNQPGLFYYGQNQTSQPFGNGTRCIGGTVFRLPIVVGSAGVLSYSVDYGSLPGGGSISAGSTWNFQSWFRDPAAGGAAFDLSDGLEITFAP